MVSKLKNLSVLLICLCAIIPLSSFTSKGYTVKNGPSYFKPNPTPIPVPMPAANGSGTGTLADPYVINSFPYTFKNANSSNGETAIGMQGACPALVCCSVKVFKVTIPANGVIYSQMLSFTPLAGSLIAYRSLKAVPTAYSDLQYISQQPYNFCGFRDTMQLGRAYQYFGSTPYGQTPPTTGLTAVYDFSSPSFQAGFMPAGDYYILYFAKNQQVNFGNGTSDVTFEFVEACSPLTVPSTVAFDTLEPNYGKDTSSFYVKNDRQLDVVIDTSALNISGADSSMFTVLQYPDTNLAKGDSTLMSVVFSPTSSGLKSASLDISFSDTNCSATSTITFSGVGTEPNIVVSGNGNIINNNDLTPNTSDNTNMGALVSNSGTITKNFKITNTGTDTLNLSGSPKVSLTGSSEFAVSVQPSKTLLLPGDSTSFTITYTPTSIGIDTAEVSIANNDASKTPFKFRIYGTGAGLNGLDFDGSGDYVNINMVGTGMTGVNTFTVETWAKIPPAQSGNDQLLAVNTSSNGSRMFFLIDDGILEFHVGSSSKVIYNQNIRDNNWHNLVFVFNNGTLDFYLDGAYTSTITNNVPAFAATDKWSIGQEYDNGGPSDFLLGTLDEFRLWKTAKTQKQILDARYCEISNPSSDLLAYYTFNQGVPSGVNTGITSLTDWSLNGLNGTLNGFSKSGATSNFVAASNVGNNCTSSFVANCTSSTYTSPSGKTYSSTGLIKDTLTTTNGDSVLYIDLRLNFIRLSQNTLSDITACIGDTLKDTMTTNLVSIMQLDDTKKDWVEINEVADSLINTNRSIFMWMRAAGTISGSQDVLVGINTSGTSTVSNFGIATNEQLWINDGGSNRNSGVVVTDGNWHFVGYTYDEGSNKTQFWVDGVAAASFSNGQSISATSRISIGQEFDGSTASNFFDGDITEVSFWNEVLDSADVSTIMKAAITSGHTKYNNLVAYYPSNSFCQDNVKQLRDYSGNSLHGVASSTSMINRDSLVSISNFNAASHFQFNLNRNGASLSTNNPFQFVLDSVGTYTAELSRDFVAISDSINVTLGSSCVNSPIASVSVDSNVSCNGLSDGAVTVSVTGGTTPYSYAWSNSDTTASISGLAAGSYTVTVTDSTGLTGTKSISISEPTLLGSSINIDANASSAGSSNGALTAAASGGTSPYTYAWSNSATTASITGLSVGNYTVTVTDSNGCTSTNSKSIIVQTVPPGFSIAITEISYNGPEAGTDTSEFIELYNYGSSSINLTGYKFTSGVVYTFPNVTVAAGGYIVVGLDSVALLNTFGVAAMQWTGGGLSNGGEPIALKNASGALIDSLRYDDNAPWPDSADGDGYTIVLCDHTLDNTDGANWSLSRKKVTGKIINTRQVYASPGGKDPGCNVSLTVGVTVDSNVTCNGVNNGGATATVSNGTAPYSYAWSNSDTTVGISGLSAGSYTVTVTDSIGDTSSASITITEPAVLIASTVVDSNISCFGFSNGKATASGSGGTTPYSYSWSNSATTASITGVPSATYMVTITDSNGCTSVDSSVITQPVVLIASASLDSNVTVVAGSNGGATASASGGKTPYTYLWSNSATTASITGVVAATYFVTVTDSNACTASDSVIIAEITGPTATIAIDSTVSCNGGSNGAVTVTVTDGKTPYSYLWSNSDTTASIFGLPAGNYSVLITDSVGDTTSSSVSISEPTVLSVSTSLDSNTSCSASTDGGLTANGTGGTLPYSFAWNNSATTAAITGLSTGKYSVIITDSNGCTATDTGTVAAMDTIKPAVVTQNINAYLNASGLVNISTTAINNGTSDACGISTLSLTKTNFTCNDVGANTVYLIATDVNGNVDSASATVTVMDTIKPVVITQNVTAYLSTNGTFTITTAAINNGTSDSCGAPTLSLSKTNLTCSNVGANTVYLIATDANGNVDSAAATVTLLDTIIPTAATQNVTVYLDANGATSITTTAINNGSADNCGAPTLSLSKTNFTCSDVGANTVYLKATDANANVDSAVATVTVMDTIKPMVVTQNATAYLSAIGTVSITTATINNGTTDSCGVSTLNLSKSSFSCSDVGANTVYLIATDANGNVDSAAATVTVMDTIKPTVVTQNVTAYLNANGAVSITATAINNGTTDSCGAPSLSLSKTNFTCSDTGVNTVYLIATDANGNVDSASATVTVLDTIKPIVVTQNVTAYLNANGTTSITTSAIDNGTTDSCGAPTLSLSKTNFNCSDIGANTIYLKATDANGNIDSATATVTVLDTIKPIVVTQNVTAYLNANGTVGIATTAINNGTTDSCGISTLSLSTSNFTCSDIGANTVYLIATDANGNVDSASATVTVLDTIKPIIVTQNITTYLSSNGTTSITTTAINNGTTDSCGISTLSLSKINFTCSDAGANTVYLIATDVNGNVDSAVATVTVLDTVKPVVVTQNITTYLNANGIGSIGTTAINNGTTDSCGAPTLSLSKSNFSCSDIGTNTVYLIAADASGNIDSAAAIVTVLDTINPLVVTQNITSYLNANGIGSITTTAIDNGTSDSCGVTTLSLSKTNFNCSNIGANTVYLIATDANGNIDSASATVTVLDTIKPLVVTQNVTAYLNTNGTAIITTTAIDNGTTDSCGVSTLSLSKTNFNCSDIGANTVYLIATDANGNIDSASATVTVLDTIKPIVVTQNVTTYLDASGAASITVSAMDNGTSDSCGVSTMSLSKTNFTCSDVGANTVYLVVTDVNGNVDSASATVTVADTIAPSLTVANDTVLCATNANGTQVSYGNQTTDNCASKAIIQRSGLASGSTFPVGITTNVFEVSDSSGNITLDSFKIEVHSFPILAIDTIKSLCETDSVITLNAIPTGGVYSGNGVTGNQFDPTAVQSGTTTITYTYTTVNNCIYSTEQYAQVRLNPNVILGAFPDTICIEQGVVACPVGTPTGGIYSGPGVDTVVVNTANAGVGNHFITYTYTDSYGCSSKDSSAANIYRCLEGVGLDEPRESQFELSIYPNPNAGRFTIEHSSSEVILCSIYSSNGSLINQIEVTENRQEIIIENSIQGIYLIRITGEQINEQRQIIVR